MRDWWDARRLGDSEKTCLKKLQKTPQSATSGPASHLLGGYLLCTLAPLLPHVDGKKRLNLYDYLVIISLNSL